MNLPPSPPPSSAYSYAGPNYYSPTPTRWKNLRKLVPYVVTFVLGAGFGAAGASDDVPAQSKAASAPIVIGIWMLLLKMPLTLPPLSLKNKLILYNLIHSVIIPSLRRFTYVWNCWICR